MCAEWPIATEPCMHHAHQHCQRPCAGMFLSASALPYVTTSCSLLRFSSCLHDANSCDAGPEILSCMLSQCQGTLYIKRHLCLPTRTPVTNPPHSTTDLPNHCRPCEPPPALPPPPVKCHSHLSVPVHSLQTSPTPAEPSACLHIYMPSLAPVLLHVQFFYLSLKLPPCLLATTSHTTQTGCTPANCVDPRIFLLYSVTPACTLC